MIPAYLCKNNKYEINFTTYDMRSKFEVFTKKKMYTLYLTESMITEWLQMIYELWDKEDKP